MIETLSTQDLLAVLPVPSAVFASSGTVVLATPAFWSSIGISGSVSSLGELASKEIGYTLAQLTSSGQTRGQLFHRCPDGLIRIIWNRIHRAGQTYTVASVVPESDTAPSGAGPVLQTSPLDLPDSQTMVGLLEQALSECAKRKVPVCIARLGMRLPDGRELREVYPDTWRSLGRRLRAACRMSDLVGFAGTGDYLVILVNCNQQQAHTVTRRVVARLNQWLSERLKHPVQICTGYADWPCNGKVTSATEMLAVANSIYKEEFSLLE